MAYQIWSGGSSLLKAIPEKIADISELRCTDLKALVSDMGYFGKMDRDILIPQVRYHTNDAWEVVSAGRPLTGGVSGYPILLRAPYSKGNMYVLTIPDDMGNLYDYPEGALNVIRTILSQDLPLRIEGPAKVALMVYDNGTFIVESLLDKAVTIRIVANEKGITLQNLQSNATLSPSAEDGKFTVTLMPHSYQVFKIIK